MEKIPSPKWFLIIVVLALIWNIIGLIAFINYTMMSPQALSELSLQEQNLYKNTPIWATAAFAVAVVAGTLGCVSLLMKKNNARVLFMASVLGVVIQNVYAFIIVDSISVYGVVSVIMPLMVFAIAICLLILAFKAKANNWLN
ncbi:hypothetical protein AADZ91_10950 [Colwelliaceae bacterium 6441]